MLVNTLDLREDISDDVFDEIFPESVRRKSKSHWSPVSIAKVAASFLVDEPGTKVLDVGSGAGKFCLIGASVTEGVFTGVEQRKHLADIAEGLFRRFGLINARVIHGNILSVDFRQYDAIYFYNPFMENICRGRRIDDTIPLSKERYRTYIQYVHQQLKGMPEQTKVVTYCSNRLKIPRCYDLQASLANGLLDLWIKRGVGY